MPEDVYLVDRLVIGVRSQERVASGQAGVDRLRVGVWIKNPVGSPGSTRRPPNMEVWDSAGRVYEVVNDAWAEPILPDTEIEAPAEFEIARDAEEVKLVLAPGDPEQVAVDLEPSP
jgi:hypothetical protein